MVQSRLHCFMLVTIQCSWNSLSKLLFISFIVDVFRSSWNISIKCVFSWMKVSHLELWVRLVMVSQNTSTFQFVAFAVMMHCVDSCVALRTLAVCTWTLWHNCSTVVRLNGSSHCCVCMWIVSVCHAYYFAFVSFMSTDWRSWSNSGFTGEFTGICWWFQLWQSLRHWSPGEHSVVLWTYLRNFSLKLLDFSMIFFLLLVCECVWWMSHETDILPRDAWNFVASVGSRLLLFSLCATNACSSCYNCFRSSG